MKAVLYFPPGGSIQQPYTSLPSLCAYLRLHNFTVQQYDLGIEAVDYFIAPARLALALSGIEQLAGKEDENRDDNYRLSIAEALLTGQDVLKNIAAAKNNLKTMHTYHDYAEYTRSRNTFLNAVKLICTEHFPHIWPGVILDQVRENPENNGSPSQGYLDNYLFNEFYDFFLDQNLVDGEMPGLSGISITYSHQLLPALMLALSIRKHCPCTHITLGGAYLTSLMTKLKDPLECASFFDYADSLVIGDGETALLRLCRKIDQQNNDWSDIPNLVYKKREEIVRQNEKHIEALNELPVPDFDGLPLAHYLSPGPILLIANSRGCYWNKCAFCELTGLAEKKYRYRKLDLVFQDLEMLAGKYNTEFFIFSVEALPPRQLREICEFILDRKLKIYWQSEVRFEKQFTPDFCRMLYKAGCRQLIFGLESANQRILDLMEKGTNLAEIREIMKNCYAAGIAISLQSFIGFPTETEEEATDTLNFLLENKEIINSFALGKYKLITNSRVYCNPQKYGIHSIIPNQIKIMSETGFKAITCNYVTTTGLSETEIEALHKKFLPVLEENFPVELSNNPIDVHALIFLALFGVDFFRSRTRKEKADRKNLLKSFFKGKNTVYPVLSPHISFKHVVTRTPYQETGSHHVTLVYNHQTGKMAFLTKFRELDKLSPLLDGRDDMNTVIDKLQTLFPDQSGIKIFFELYNHGIIELPVKTPCAEPINNTDRAATDYQEKESSI